MKRVLFFFMLIPLFTACNDNDPDYSLDKFVTDLVTIENPDQATTFFMHTDDSTRLWTIATNLKYYRPKDGQRVIANYTLLSDKPDSAAYDHDVKLNDVYEVLTKGIFNITAATQDSIGNDNVYIEDMWIGNHFLNVEFVYPGGHKMHFINLVSDTSKVYNDGKIHLEFRHNANNDYPTYNRWGLVSFNLKSLETQATDTLSIVVHTKEFDLGEKTYNLTYHFGSSPAGAPRRVSMKPLKALVE